MPTEPDFEFDVFISYSSKDKEWVRGELLKRIESAGLKAFIDFRDFKPGAASIKECECGVVKCRKTLLILTPNYIGSGWGEIENVMVQTLDPANESLRLIPLIKVECKKPLRIGALTHIDFTDGEDHELAWRKLFTALGKPPQQEPPKEPDRGGWFLAHPYAMPPNFTGRLAERAMLNLWLNRDDAHRLLILRALGGFGKSALVWHWLTYEVQPTVWPRVIWWSFYEGDASFDNFLEKSIKYLQPSDPTRLGPREQVDQLVGDLQQPGTLLVLDGFERVLRAFGGIGAAYQGDDVPHDEASERESISPLADHFLRAVVSRPALKGKVLLTTRLRPHAVETRDGQKLAGCREEELKQMQPADAVAFFHAQGIRGTHTEIETTCAPYGYHPLSLRLLAGLIAGDFQQPGDIAVAKRLDVSGDLVQRRHHVLEMAYDSLTPSRQALLGRIACFRSPVKYETLKALAEGSPDADLRDLVARGLLHHDTREGRFDLHPIVRRYAYDRLAAPDRTVSHARLRDYFAAIPKPDKVTRLEDLATLIEFYHHTVRAGQLDEALTLYHDRLKDALYYQFGAYVLIVDLLRVLFPEGEDRPPRLKDLSEQAWTLNSLANSYSLNGQPRRAAPLYLQHNAIFENLGDRSNEDLSDKVNLAIGLGNAADDQAKIGALRAAEANLLRCIALCLEIKEKGYEAMGHQELGRLLAYRGAVAESETELQASTLYWKKTNNLQGQCLDEANCALRELLRLRTTAQSAIRNRDTAIALALRALELADEKARTDRPNARDYVRAHWLLGAAYRVAGQPDVAERHLHEALERCRRINAVEVEADILIDLARLRASTGARDEAQRLAEEALLITERSSYVLQGADAHLELAKLALGRNDKVTAREHAQQAKELATCDGPPDYTYKAAYVEAEALLKKLR